MAISKPSWLRSWLSNLNWEILTWRVYVGDAIEDAIDWAVDWINWAIYQAESAYAWARSAWDKALDVGRDLGALINREIQKVLNNIEAWWGDLGEWWEAKRQDILDWIDTAQDWLLDRVDDVRKGLASLGQTWDNFWENIWPQLLKDFNAWIVKVGEFFADILPGLASRFDITKAFDDFMLAWQDLFNFWVGFKTDLVAFLTDPLEWLWGKFTDWFLGPEV